MIWESGPWKEELYRIAERLHKKTGQRRWTDRTDANLEKDVFVGCYAIRKLMEARRLSETVLAAAVPCTAAPARPGKMVTLRNWHRLDDLYDFDGQSETSLSLKDLCNQFIHSYVFCPVFGEDDLLEAVAVTSDHRRRHCVQIIRVAELIRVMRMVALDAPDYSRAVWDEKAGDYRVTNR